MDRNKREGLRTGGSLSWSEREAMIAEYLTGRHTKAELWAKYTGQSEEHGQLLAWMRKLGYISGQKARQPLTFRSHVPFTMLNEESDPQALQKRIEELEKQLEAARLQAEGYELMIQIAERELHIPIRKKSAAK